MTRSVMVSQLDFKCHPIGKTLRIIGPFTYCDNGGHAGTSIRKVNGRYLVSGRYDALMNMKARGISLTKKRLDEIQQLLFKKGAELDARGEIVAWAIEKDVGAITSDIIRAGILASTLSLDRYQPVRAKRFKSMVIDCLYHIELRNALSLRENVYGLSGHQITAPVTIKADVPKYIFTSSVKHGGSWNSVYSLFGKLIDLRASNEECNSRFAIIDSKAAGDRIQQLSLLFYESNQVLPFSEGKTWVKRLAA